MLNNIRDHVMYSIRDHVNVYSKRTKFATQFYKTDVHVNVEFCAAQLYKTDDHVNVQWEVATPLCTLRQSEIEASTCYVPGQFDHSRCNKSYYSDNQQVRACTAPEMPIPIILHGA